ncbi:DUF1064 domain-containing protein [Lentilactobacillus senioris]|uniref:DUF1064 domain-containing protein n=1 Tax=Lentilactobacillus senioris TaxID=931534 RepID=UPI002282707A|nr:DUF1064 domain-containing protein [Lentilactobacillus senioris]MCY9806543.1 DUF1064 domain-containing protein [Lentilactobacillus senioris]
MVKYPTGTKRPKAKRNSKAKRKSKFNNRHVVIDGIEFDSQLEGNYYLHIKALKLDFKYHESFEILPKFSLSGKNYQHRIYTPDFTIYSKGELVSVIDCKGGNATITADSRLRMVMFMEKYRVPVVIAKWDAKAKVFHEEIK